MLERLDRTERYLVDHLIPFWQTRIVEPNHGGFNANYDRDGRRTDVTEKSLLCQARTIFTLSHTIRMGFDWEGSREQLAQGIDFLVERFADPEHGGYYWLLEEDGRVVDDSKTIYGFSFLVYGLAEHALLTGDERSERLARDLYDLLRAKAADLRLGGFYEHFDRAFNLVSVRRGGELHKSLDTHMHLMEAFTTLYELTGDPSHRRALEQIVELVFDRMIHRETGLGVAMFAPDWTPIPNEPLATLWGRDRFEPAGKPPEITSYGHNIEFAWLYLHTLDILGIDRRAGLPRVQPIFQHTLNHGVDWEYGGLYTEGHRLHGPTEEAKEFWQQGEAMVGFLDAYLLTKDRKYLRAFERVHDFVFEKLINWEQGEWFALLSREGEVVWDYMGYNWKIMYHSMRATVETIRRLRQVIETSD